MHNPFPRNRPPTAEVMGNLRIHPDPWQVAVIESQHPQLLLNCCRQAGKTTVVAIIGLLEAMCNAMTRVILVSRSHRQSREILRLMSFFNKLLGNRVKARITAEEMEFSNMSRIVSMPCREDTIRGFAHVDLLIIDEAARVPDDLYRAVRPMLAVSKGRLICLSTPFGKRGFFWKAWASGGDDWARFEVPATQIPRIAPDFLDKERRALGEAWFRQEYCCSFEATEGLVYPDFVRCVAPSPPAFLPGGEGRMVGGIDFGFRNPFAAIWGFVDRDDILWLTGEHYAAQKPLSYHAQKLPKDVMWYADPSGANEIAELQRAGFKVRRGDNKLCSGIAAVSGRLQSDSLRIVEGRCPNLLVEAGLYRYPDSSDGADGENPIDKNNHALAALRYLISRIDARHLAFDRSAKQEAATEHSHRKQIDRDDERYWTPIR